MKQQQIPEEIDSDGFVDLENCHTQVATDAQKPRSYYLSILEKRCLREGSLYLTALDRFQLENPPSTDVLYLNSDLVGLIIGTNYVQEGLI